METITWHTEIYVVWQCAYIHRVAGISLFHGENTETKVQYNNTANSPLHGLSLIKISFQTLMHLGQVRSQTISNINQAPHSPTSTYVHPCWAYAGRDRVIEAQQSNKPKLTESNTTPKKI